MVNKERERKYQHEYYLRKTIQKRAKLRAERPLVTKTCIVCGKTFQVDYLHAKRQTCSDECKTAHHKKVQKAYRQSEHGKEMRKAYSKTEKFKIGRKKLEQSPQRKAYYKAYYSSEHGKAIVKAYQQTEKYRTYQREYARKRKERKVVDNKVS